LVVFVMRDDEHGSLRVEHDGNRDATEQLRLDPPESTGTQDDGFGVELIGDLADQPPRFSLLEATLNLEARCIISRATP
jgi:hypothetical protein